MAKSAPTALGMEIKIGAIKKNMTHTQLAEKIGTSLNYLGHIMYGRKNGGKYIPLIEKALEIDLSRFKENEAAS